MTDKTFISALVGLRLGSKLYAKLVLVEQLAGATHRYLTPDQAREMATALVAMADQIDGTEGN